MAGAVDGLEAEHCEVVVVGYSGGDEVLIQELSLAKRARMC